MYIVIITWLQQESSQQGRVKLESCLDLVNCVMGVRQQIQHPSPALLQVGDDLEGLGVVGEHLDLEHLRPRGLQWIAVKPVRHCEGLNFNGCK